MGAGTLAWAFLCVALGQAPAADIVHSNQKALRIPVNFEQARRAEIRELLLFVSRDQGRTWGQFATITPEKEAFTFFAPSDGMYWLRVALVNKAGRQEPMDLSVGAPDQKIQIDTLKPVVRFLNAQRQGDEVVVNWEVQEEHPDLDSLRIEYQTKENSSPLWTAIKATGGLTGQARFRPGSGAALTVRLSVVDAATNQSYAVAEVAGAPINTVAFNNQPGANPPVQPKDQQPFAPPAGESPLLGSAIQVPGPMAPPPIVQPPVPKPNEGLVAPINSQSQKMTDIGIVPPPLEPITTMKPPVQEVKTPEPVKQQVVASSSWAAKNEVPVQPNLNKGTGEPKPGMVETNPQPLATGQPARKPLPPLQYVNRNEVTMEYSLARVGPSGIGSVELWWTQDDGRNWELYAKEPDVQGISGKQTSSVPLPNSDGVYGFFLVVKSRAGLGRNPPRVGDAPEIRVELDTTPPVAELFKPVRDPHKRDQLLIPWHASDKNLAKTPVNLEWAEKLDGPWTPIALNLENTGRYSWKLPERLPVQIFMRLRVRDEAGNESVAATPEPQTVDLQEPEVESIILVPSKKQ